ncbi:alternative ribosome rescue aminoacyl-tRNA hydrolase ArfB [Mucilaginibacter aquatilis]|uniref:Aminoacyl-tRNA hydrolase n=1 Tax=Mucilaginibacter aquatilis TaxID=1517760 RepID=A0A6I4IPS5_9SPHI|nr:alternative ribosome rescue aminoacyl-tRNA hydrolase ArfB [Mucilaginibacter aquatilis]MVN89834.1 aminoacyl-tRNA hydrolase [Mucilaginibacter aquatilis]
MNIFKPDLQREITYKASRSGGKGGQNVNKVSTKVELLFDITNSLLFTPDEKERLLIKLQNRLNKNGELQIISEEERSQLMNKERALDKMIVILKDALYIPKVRKPTKVSKQAKAKRLEAKRIQSVKKQLRRSGME